MKRKLDSIFRVLDEKIVIYQDNTSNEVFKVITESMGNFYICAKQITFGGRENLDYEKRIQIKGDSNNLVESKIDENTQGFLLGIIEIDKEPILCTFMVKHSDALNTLSKQIKISTIYEAKENGFAQQRKGKEYACAFKKEFLYFYSNFAVKNCMCILKIQ